MARTSFEFQFGQPRGQPARERDADAPLRLVVIGDLTGRVSRGLHEPATLPARRLVRLDIDNFGDVLSRLAPEVHLALADSGAGVTIPFRSLDDFEPDSLYEHLEIFASLRDSRRRLLDPAQFADEAARLRGSAIEPPPPAPPPDASSAAAEVSGADLLSQMLARRPVSPAAASPARPITIGGLDLSRLIESIVAPYVVPKADPRQAEYVAAVDQAIADLLRHLLHARPFQALEAAWRQLWRVTQTVTGGDAVHLFVLDSTRAELSADLAAAAGGIEQTGLYRLLVDQHVNAVEGQPWGALVLLERFGRGADDCRLLAALGALASVAGGPLLADATADVVGLADWSLAADVADWKRGDVEAEKLWGALRASPLARSIGLAAPRPLVRLPYGADHPTERLTFDELGATRSHESFLWGSAALACAEVLGRAACGDELPNELDDLPPCVYQEEGERRLLPGAEVFLSERAGEALATRGVIPLLSYRNRHAVRILRLPSLADPPTPLVSSGGADFRRK